MNRGVRLSFVLSSLCLCVSVVPSSADWPVFAGNALQEGVARSALTATCRPLEVPRRRQH